MRGTGWPRIALAPSTSLMDREAALIDRLRLLATHPGARGLGDDAAVLDGLVVTHDMMVEGVHWLPDADPADVAWKLLAVNLSDLAAKGAVPTGVLLGLTLGDDAGWEARFVDGLAEAMAAMGPVALLGGDTTRGPPAGRVLGMTALGRATARPVPDRRAARAGETLWLAGPVGDAGAGLEALRSGSTPDRRLSMAHARPLPLLREGQALAPVTRAMMDVSDGLLIDAERMALASGTCIVVDLASLPLSHAFKAARGQDRDARWFAATSGDDYALLFTLPPGVVPPVAAVPVGRVEAGQGLSIIEGSLPVSPPGPLGWTHG